MATHWSVYLWVALGGSLGAMMRFYLTQVSVSWFGKQFPFGTLAVNVIGAFLIAVLYGLIQRGIISEMPYKFFIGVGLMGALTTFSTFSIDTLTLLENGLWLKAALNIILNVFVCLLAAFLGVQLMKG